MINVKDLVKKYNDVPVVNNVSFNVGKGELVGLLGPNGAGKTTIMRILTCYLYPNSGEVLIEGKNIFDDPVAIKKLIGYLPENTPQYGDMTTYEYLNFIAEVRGIDYKQIKKSIIDMVELISLEEVLSKKVNQLSKGFQKRVGLASVMIHDPQILILDEPTTGLDPNQVITFRKILRRLSEKKTVILSTHVLSEIEATCEKVIVIKKGNIVANDTIQNLIGNFTDQFIEFSVKADNILDVEKTLSSLKSAWKLEFIKKDGRDVFRFKALITKDSDFKDELKRVINENKWELVEESINKANLEEVFLKLAGEDE